MALNSAFLVVALVGCVFLIFRAFAYWQEAHNRGRVYRLLRMLKDDPDLPADVRARLTNYANELETSYHISLETDYYWVQPAVDNDLVNQADKFIRHSNAGRSAIIFGLTVNDFIYGSLQWMTGLQMNALLQQMVNSSDYPMLDQPAATGIAIVLSVAFAINRMEFANWATRKLGPSGMTIFEKSKYEDLYEKLSALQKKAN